MIKIFTVLKDGEILSRQMLDGIMHQNVPCSLVPITSKGTDVYSENNRRENVLRAMEANTEDYFFLIDSDVVMVNASLIKDFFDESQNSGTKVRTATTKGEQMMTCCYIPHALILVLGNEVENFKKYIMWYDLKDNDKKENCIICGYLNYYTQKCGQVLTLQNNQTYEIKR